MQIIMSAGDARVSCNDALKAIAEGNVESARELIKKAEGQIAEAHHVQTDAIQGSIGGETQAYSLLFAHAQDTLMTVYSEIHMTKQLLLIFEGYEQRIRTLEEKIAK